MALDEGVPVGVGEDLLLVEDGAVVQVELGQGGDPFAMHRAEVGGVDALGPELVHHRRRQQGQLGQRPVGVEEADAFLLLADQLRGGFVDRQLAANPLLLPVVVDENGLALPVPVQAVGIR